MKKLSWLIAVAAIAVVFFQCQKELHYTGGPDNGNSVTPDPITTSVQGNITDENDQPAAGVTVTAGTSTTITDDKGYFRFTNTSLDKNTTLVTASKDGYFKGYRVFAATSGCNQVAIKLIKKEVAGTVASATGGEVAASNGAKVKLPANGVVTAASGSAYSGDVKVYASYINPQSADIRKTIPGSLVANDKDGKRVSLQSYGMLAVELSSTSGEKLQIKSGSTATLTIPIPSSSVAAAPATIPLWYVDEATGIWQEEGTATKQGSNYVGEVKHFSFWNCDYPNDAVTLSLTLNTPDGSPLINEQVSITAKISSDTSSYLSTTYGWTDSLGQVKGLVPANEDLKLTVSGNCGSAVYSQDIQALTQNKDLGTITITDNTASLLTFTGTLLNCTSTPVTKGYAFIVFDGYSRYVSVDNKGKFTTTFIKCNGSPNNATIIGVDNDTEQQSDPLDVTATQSATDVGFITACGTSSDQYVNYKLDGTDYSIASQSADSSISGTYNGGFTTISAFESSDNHISFGAYANAAGTFTLSSFSISQSDSLSLNQPASNITFTNFPDVGGFFTGTLSAKYMDASSVSHNVTATFKVRRNN